MVSNNPHELALEDSVMLSKILAYNKIKSIILFFYLHSSNFVYIYLIVYVNDIVIIGNDYKGIDKFKHVEMLFDIFLVLRCLNLIQAYLFV